MSDSLTHEQNFVPRQMFVIRSYLQYTLKPFVMYRLSSTSLLAN